MISKRGRHGVESEVGENVEDPVEDPVEAIATGIFTGKFTGISRISTCFCALTPNDTDFDFLGIRLVGMEFNGWRCAREVEWGGKSEEVEDRSVDKVVDENVD